MRCNKKNGFLLIEFVVYLGLFSLLSIFVGTLLVTTQRDIRLMNTQGECLLRLELALDVLARDVQGGSAAIETWDCSRNIWKKMYLDHTGEIRATCIKWNVKKGKLIRTEGDYDFNNRLWRKKVKSVVVYTADVLRFTLNKSSDGKRIRWVDVYCDVPNAAPISLSIPLRNTIISNANVS